ncbi:uncharacterized protein LOC110836065 [Zootermopsis nevadensis]|uniref:uncharacterized protein LOC110836065 n=1 Tax=Zootermopsis nevadensis TaxID=136037 RepID=UPI000B8E7965|nr:uncharacterized protein LOC110836065 [Zootermopsis nevadensis]
MIGNSQHTTDFYKWATASVKFQGLLECIVPHKMVSSKAALNLLQWIFTYFCTAPIGSVKSALEWIISLIKFGLRDEVPIHHFIIIFICFLKMRDWLLLSAN